MTLRTEAKVPKCYPLGPDAAGNAGTNGAEVFPRSPGWDPA